MISVPVPSHALVFFTACAIIAAIDVLDAAGFYEENMIFKETNPVNENFDLFGIGDKNFFMNSGSYVPF